MTPLRSLLMKVRGLSGEAVKFAVVGFTAFVTNYIFFNAFLSAHVGPTTSTVVATIFATVVTYVGNRYWVYRDRRNSESSLSRRRELFLFVLSNAIAAGIQAGCLAISTYGFDFTSRLAENVSNYCFGMVLGTVFRFWTYRTWIFPPDKSQGVEADLELAGTSAWGNERTPA